MGMSEIGPLFSGEELYALAEAIYERDILPKLTPDDDGKFLAIDVTTGDYELNEVDLTAVTRLRERLPDSQTCLMRVGWEAAYRIFGRFLVCDQLISPEQFAPEVKSC